VLDHQSLSAALPKTASFVCSPDGSKVPANAARVFGMKEPVQGAEKCGLKKAQCKCPGPTLPCEAVGEEPMSCSARRPALLTNSARLSRVLKETSALHFWPGAAHQATRGRQGCFCQGQLVRPLSTPPEEELQQLRPQSLVGTARLPSMALWQCN
jgi:hypothetical protein